MTSALGTVTLIGCDCRDAQRASDTSSLLAKEVSDAHCGVATGLGGIVTERAFKPDYAGAMVDSMLEPTKDERATTAQSRHRRPR